MRILEKFQIFYSVFQVASLAASYEHRLTKGNKSIYHLEAFVAKFMSVYMRFVEETMDDF